jgi:hypothetical protein
MVTPPERKLLHDYYCKDESLDFRQGAGISIRLANMLDWSTLLLSIFC